MSSDNTGVPNAGREQKSGVCNLALIALSLTVSAGAGVTAGDPHTLRTAGQAGTRMGSLVAWGGEGSWDKGQTKVPGGNDYVAVAAGMYHSLALRANGSVAAWGDHTFGQCNAPAGDDYVAIDAGFHHSLALRADGRLAAWGSNADGQCNVPAGLDFVAIAGGADHCLALKADGSIVAWGNNQFGQCRVPQGLTCRAIAAGWRHSLALTADGALVAWGIDISGECDVPEGTDFIAIACGDHHNMAQRTDGSITAWGLRANGRCDLPAGAGNVQAFCGGGHHSLILRSDGSLVAWGNCGSGACACPAGNTYIAIAAGTHHNLAIMMANPTTYERKTVVEHVIVANPGNPDDIHADHQGNSYGGVPYVYRIGKYEVTAAQYCAFLNAVAADDPHNLYDPAMAGGQTQWDSGCRIERHGQPGAYTYRVSPDWADRPVNFVDFWDACRFANWLHNGMPAGPQNANSTEDGAYTLNGYTGHDGRQIARRPGARVWIPSADEWYKAAYHKNDGTTGHYWDYPTGSDVQPSNRLIDPDPGNNANFGIYHKNDYTLGPPYWRTEAGEFENSASPYGTRDQAGNIREWTDSPAGVNDPDRIQHGSSYLSNLENRAGEMGRHASRPDAGNMSVGFRVAAERLKGDLGGRNGQPDGVVDFVDLAVLASAWMTGPNDDRWNASCDITQTSGVDMLDLRLFVEDWLAGGGS